MIFAGLTSRCMTPCSCAVTRASAISTAYFRARSAGSGPLLILSARVSPCRYSMTKKSTPSSRVFHQVGPSSFWILRACDPLVVAVVVLMTSVSIVMVFPLEYAAEVPQELLSLWDDVPLQWAREVSEHPPVAAKVARYVEIHRQLKAEPRATTHGPRTGVVRKTRRPTPRSAICRRLRVDRDSTVKRESYNRMRALIDLKYLPSSPDSPVRWPPAHATRGARWRATGRPPRPGRAYGGGRPRGDRRAVLDRHPRDAHHGSPVRPPCGGAPS